MKEYLTNAAPIANLSLNSQAAVIFEIRKQEQVHWFLGLRQSELFIQEKEAALAYNYRLQRSQDRTIRSKKRDLAALQANYRPNIEDQDRIEELQDRIEAASYEMQKLQPLIRDAVMELKTAQLEKERILAQHPEALELSYEELQQRYTPVALLEVQSRFAAARIWAAKNNLPEGVGQMFFELLPEQRQYVMVREMEMRSNVKVQETLSHATAILSGYPEEVRSQALIQAASTLADSQDREQEL